MAKVVFRFGGGNMGNLVKQAQKMQKDMEKPEELKDKTVEASAGGGTITVVASGRKEIKEITIKQVVDPDDVEMLQDLIVAAVNEAIRKADDMVNSEMNKITGGLGGIPGLF